jgi:hypothetical protein
MTVGVNTVSDEIIMYSLKMKNKFPRGVTTKRCL